MGEFRTSDVGLQVFNLLAGLRQDVNRAARPGDVAAIPGIDLTGVADSTAALQAAVNAAIAGKYALFVPIGTIRTTAPINITGPLTLLGVSRGGGQSSVSNPAPVASRFLFDHLGKGFLIAKPGGVAAGVVIQDIMTSRNQPEPGDGAWTPIAADYDISLNNATDVTIQRCMIFNATRGIDHNTGGRLDIIDLHMQAFVSGVRMNMIGDVNRIIDLHQWPFWRDHIEVHRYALNNLDTIQMGRVDTPEIRGLFSIGHRSAVRVSDFGQGRLSKGVIVSGRLDYGVKGIWCDSTSNNATFQWLFADTQGVQVATGNFPAVTGSIGVHCEGAGTFLDIIGAQFGGAAGATVRVDGPGVDLTLSGRTWLLSYGQQGGNNEAAFQNNNINSKITIAEPLRVSAGGVGAGSLFGGTGIINACERRSWVPAITAQAGTFDAAPTVIQATYQRHANRLAGQMRIIIADVGTAVGYVRATLPEVIGDQVTARGINTSTGYNLSVFIFAGTNIMQISTNGQPNFIDGADLLVSFECLLP